MIVVKDSKKYDRVVCWIAQGVKAATNPARSYGKNILREQWRGRCLLLPTCQVGRLDRRGREACAEKVEPQEWHQTAV